MTKKQKLETAEAAIASARLNREAAIASALAAYEAAIESNKELKNT